jgi:hypothetical protein
MSKHRVTVLKVVSKQLSVTAAAAGSGLSRGHLHRLLHRYRDGGLDALEPRSRRPRSNPRRTPDGVRVRIVELRTELTGRGLDAGPLTIAWHLGREGKIERFHQTLKRWLQSRPAARTLAELQAQLDAFRLEYNDRRPHRAIGRNTPAEAYAATPRAHPAGRGALGHFRLRYDVVDKKGAITLRRAGRLHHLRVGAAFAHRRVLAIVDEEAVTVVALATGEIFSTHQIDPDKGYWRNQRRDPGRWPGSPATD